MHAAAPFPILLVEDSDDDQFLFRRLLAKAKITHPLSIATNGQDAIDQLKEHIASGNPQATPRLVFLDLKLPLRSGFEVLQWIRAQSQLQSVAVIILSSSAESRDVSRAYELGAHGYLVKYPAPAVFADIVGKIDRIPHGLGLEGAVFPGVAKP